MLLTFLYHHIFNKGKYSNSLDVIKKHLIHLKKNYSLVTPGDPLDYKKINVCLTFDDGYFDFYYFLYPILKELKIKVVLSLPVGFILDSSSIIPSLRVEKANVDPFKDYQKYGTFCTFEELKEMLKENVIHIASHSVSHIDLTQKCDLQKEIIDSKNTLEKNLPTKISTFTYPMGKFNKEVHELASKHYRYIMRIGSALNFSWHNKNNLIYRINSDNLSHINENLRFWRYSTYFLKFFLNTVRKK